MEIFKYVCSFKKYNKYCKAKRIKCKKHIFKSSQIVGLQPYKSKSSFYMFIGMANGIMMIPTSPNIKVNMH